MLVFLSPTFSLTSRVWDSQEAVLEVKTKAKAFTKPILSVLLGGKSPHPAADPHFPSPPLATDILKEAFLAVLDFPRQVSFQVCSSLSSRGIPAGTDNAPLFLPRGQAFFPHHVDIFLAFKFIHELLVYPRGSPAIFSQFHALRDALILRLEEVMFKH